ncbi:cell division protein FtsQ/DivIB [Olsenella profusa]|uniref:FtsQ-type POTRA domain-containing protein n=1 Tax=Olsenella profusa TaxID=138595 RepID=A0ABS2F334_9ACTN|nr:FtsQ-type POTRA domain-containing protein [Olsenella profusa]MBM6774957.1 FtsQ-type POTRA domain-containing protein [Olsenella profusa]
MARDASRRPTPRKKEPRRTGAPARTAAPRAARRATAPRARSAAPAASASHRGSTPAFLGGPSARTAPTASASPRDRRQRHQRGQALRVAAGVLGVLLAVALVAVVVLFALRDSSVFEITSVEVQPTEHVSATDVQNLAQVPVGSTLLNVDTSAIESALRRNPWVASVGFERIFPHTLKLTIIEQRPDALVVMSSGSVGWYLGDADVWIQPAKIEPAEGQSTDDAALDLALSEGCLLITDVPSTVDPKAGSVATDDVLAAVDAFRTGFSEDFSSQVVCYFAPSPDDISCMLKSGVQISLGSATNVEEKETLARGLLEKYPDSAVSINVRVITNPSVKPVDSSYVGPGDGVSVDEGGSGAEAGAGGDAGTGDAATSEPTGADNAGADDGSDQAGAGSDGAQDAPADDGSGQ